MSNQPYDLLKEHTYDGIQEYDNPTPGWWWGLFNLTVIFSVGYFLFFHVGNQAWTLSESLDSAVAANLKLQFGEIGDLTADEPTLLKYMGLEQWLKVGEITFKARCASCHGANAEGQVGPNLTDDHWKNVKKLTDLVSVIENGANNGAMPAWKSTLHPNEIVLTAAYIAQLRGRNLPGPRGTEGEPIPPWPARSAESQNPAEPARPSDPGASPPAKG